MHLGTAALAGGVELLAGGAFLWGMRRSRPHQEESTGWPGIEPRWSPSDKSGIGTGMNPSTSSTSLVWFTLAHGVLTEVFHPRLHHPCVRDLSLAGHGRTLSFRTRPRRRARRRDRRGREPAVPADQHLPRGPVSDREDDDRPSAPGRGRAARRLHAARGEAGGLSRLRDAEPAHGAQERPGEHGVGRVVQGPSHALRAAGASRDGSGLFGALGILCGGVRRRLRRLARAAAARPEARYLVFQSFARHEKTGKPYYECVTLDLADHPQTILAYELNGEPLPVQHGARYGCGSRRSWASRW